MSVSMSGIKGLWNQDRDAKRVAVVMVVALACGAVLVVLATSNWSMAFAGLLWAAACSSVGWFLGFLFGIPRSLSTDTARTTAPAAPDGTAPPPEADRGADAPARPVLAAGPAASTAVNTNLEQISDWLTKIIVGVTLVESKEVLDHLSQAARLMAGSLGGESAVSFAFAILIYFSFSGLLGSYLLTRLFLQRAFTTAANSTGDADR
jgi:hypothetical protein